MANWLATFGDAVGKRLMPVLDSRLDVMQKMLEAKVDQFLVDARADIPRIAKDIAQTAVQTVFDNTQIDEAADNAMNVVNQFFAHLGVKLS